MAIPTCIQDGEPISAGQTHAVLRLKRDEVRGAPVAVQLSIFARTPSHSDSARHSVLSPVKDVSVQSWVRTVSG